MTTYKDILLAETGEGSPVIVAAPCYRFKPGSLVAYDGGKLATVQKRAWAGETESSKDIFDIFASIIPVYDAEACYTRSWEAEMQQEEVGDDAEGSS